MKLATASGLHSGNLHRYWDIEFVRPHVGISGYVVRPPQARREKPRVSAFTPANIDKILGLKPDLVLTFSELQADIAANLVRPGARRPCL